MLKWYGVLPQAMKIIIISLAALIFITGCAGQFAEGLRVMGGKGGTKEKIDTFPDLNKQAAEIAKAYPKPRWQKVFRADAADIFDLLPGKRVLLGEVQVSTAIAEPKYGDLSLYDLKTGNKLWTVKRRDLEWGRYDVLAAKPGLLLQGTSPKGGYYFALNAKTGETIWEHDFKATERGVYDAANNRVYVLDVAKEKSTLRALNTLNGNVLWQKTLSGLGENAAVELAPTKTSLYVLAGKVYKIQSASGTIRWQKTIPKEFDNWKTLKLRVTARGVLLWDWRRMALLNTKSGKIRWGPVYPKTPGHKALLVYEGISNMSIPKRGDHIFAYTTRDNVYRFDLRSGRKSWKYAKHKKDGTDLTGPFVLASGKLYFTTYNSLTILNAKTGKRLARVQFPSLESGLFGELAPDIIIERGNKIILAREGGAVYAFSKKTNKMLWKQILDWKYEQFHISNRINRELQKLLSVQSFAEKKTRETAAWWSSWTNAVDYQWRGYKYPGSQGAQLSSFGASMVLFQSMLGLSETIERGIKQAALEGLAERLNMELANATKNHLRSIQRGYFIRPFDSSHGTLVMLVHLDTGKRCDLVYSPINIGMRYIDMRLPSFIVDPTGKSLYTSEVGIRSERYEKYVKFKLGMPYPSLVRYNFADMRFK